MFTVHHGPSMTTEVYVVSAIVAGECQFD